MEENRPLRPFPYGDRVYETRMTTKFDRRVPYIPPRRTHLLCVIPGIIHSILVREGQKVIEGQPLLILEAMKMQNEIRSPFSGTIRTIHAAVGKRTAKGDLLLEFAGE
jgi:biotin carboxyl carrier protein